MKQQKVYDEEKVIYLLKNKDKLRKSYNERELQLLKELESYSYTVEGISLRSRELKEFVLSKTNVQVDSVFSILEAVEKERANMLYERMKWLKEIGNKKIELEILLNVLEMMDEPYKGILKMLYIEGRSWKEVCCELGISNSTCCRYRKQGMMLIIANVNSIN